MVALEGSAKVAASTGGLELVYELGGGDEAGVFALFASDLAEGGGEVGFAETNGACVFR